MNNNVLEFLITAKDEASQVISGITGKLESMKPAFQGMAVVGTAGFAAITAEVFKATDAFSESQAQLQIVDSIVSTFSKDTLKQFSGSTEIASDVIKDFGDEMQALGGIAGEEVSISMAKFMQVTKDSNVAMEAASVAADLATFKQIDFATASDVVTKVLMGKTAMLSKYGIVVKEGATAEEALAAITAVAGGQYEAFGQTVAGQTKIMKESFGDLQENIGESLLPLLTQLFEAVQPVLLAMVTWTRENPVLTRNIILASAAIFGLLAVLGTLGLVLPTIIAGFVMLAGPVGIIIAILGLLILTVTNVVKSIEMLRDDGKVIWEGIKLYWQDAINAIVGFFSPLTNAIQGVMDKLSSLASMARSVASGIGSSISGAYQGVTSALGFRAEGGSVSAGSPYVVGERGAEMFIPSVSGHIVPNNQLSGAGGGNFNFNISINGGMITKETAGQIGDLMLDRFKRIARIGN